MKHNEKGAVFGAIATAVVLALAGIGGVSGTMAAAEACPENYCSGQYGGCASSQTFYYGGQQYTCEITNWSCTSATVCTRSCTWGSNCQPS